jgi:hypothetical protein
MTPRRSPLTTVALVTAVASVILALTLPNRPAPLALCPPGRIVDCALQVDHRVPERVGIVIVGFAIAALLLFAARRYARDTQDAGGHGMVEGAGARPDETSGREGPEHGDLPPHS